MKPRQINELITYLMVGFVNFMVCVLTMRLLASYHVHYLLYTAAGYGLAICCSFFLNLKFTFKASEFTQQRLLKFILINVSNLLIVGMIEHALIEQLHIRELYAVIWGMIWYTGSGYIANKFFVYTCEQNENNYSMR